MCTGQKKTHDFIINWLKEGLQTNHDRPFFTFGFSSEYTHNGNECFGLLEDASLDFLYTVTNMEHYNNTFVFLISDHGSRFGAIRHLEIGKLEERTPYFGIIVPPNFRHEFPGKYKHFLSNTNRLTTPLDIYNTLIDILGEYEDTDLKKRSYSLFENIPEERTCADAGIEPHWCTCLTWNKVSHSDKNVTIVATAVVEYINSLMTCPTPLS